MANAQAMVDEARLWIGTPFHHQGRVKGIGCDCIGLVLGVINAVGVRSRTLDAAGDPVPFTDFDETDYAPDPNGQRLKEKMDCHFTKVALSRIRAGDVLLFRIIHLPQHVGIVAPHPIGGLSLIHAYAPARRVVEERLSPSWMHRVIGAYRIPVSCWRAI